MPKYIPKPGVTFGLYPEQRNEKPIRLPGNINPLGILRNRSDRKLSSLAEILKKVNATGKQYESKSEEEIQALLIVIRLSLNKDGLTEKNVIEAFSLIRVLCERTLGMKHYDTQVLGALIIINGMMAEINTGEGKTLTATLAAGTAALAGTPTHILTVNHYLAYRDASQMAPLYNALGLSVGVATEKQTDDERRKAYLCDITYCTGKQVAFDYLRDRMILKNSHSRLHLQLRTLSDGDFQLEPLFLRGLCFAIIDEADSILADEALNPLVIAREEVLPEQEKIYQQALSVARQLILDIDFLIDKRSSSVQLTHTGEEKVNAIGPTNNGIWNGKKRRAQLVQLGLSGLYLYEKNKHYLVENKKIVIIDQNTGRLMEDRSWEYGLHQIIELKEDCPLTGQRNTLAKLTFQRFFRRYLKIGGMSGTVMDLRDELFDTYGLRTVGIPSNKKSCLEKYPTYLFVKENDKWSACLNRVKALHKTGRPILIGTRTIFESDHISCLLKKQGLNHEVLNARNTEFEAKIISNGGKSGSIIVATNVAGRGTDIILDQKSKEKGGLHVIVIEQNDARRIDFQLFGRCARHGDPGSSEMLLSLESPVIKAFYYDWVLFLLSKLGRKSGYLPTWLGEKIIRLPQKVIENRQKKIRDSLLVSNDQIEKVLSFTENPD